MERNVGSAWGLPVIKEGSRNISALAVSEQLEPPGRACRILAADSPEGDIPRGKGPSLTAGNLAAERLMRLEACGVGPLGRYLGGEPMRPIPLGPAEFFGFAETAGSPGLPPFGGLEYGGPRWVEGGAEEDVFRGHLEFLRTWGFSGGIEAEAERLPALFTSYLRFLQKDLQETRQGGKIIFLGSKHWTETRLEPLLAGTGISLRSSGDPGAGEIPLNIAAGGEPVWGSTFHGLGAVLREDLPPNLPARKALCDILITLEDGPGQAAPGIEARLRLSITPLRKGADRGKDPSPADKIPLRKYLFRGLSPLSFPAAPSSCRRRSRKPDPPVIHPGGGTGSAKNPGSAEGMDQLFYQNPPGNRLLSSQEAAALGLLPQWEAGRVEAAEGGLFVVIAKFAGLPAVELKEEQAFFYRDAPRPSGGNRYGPPEPPPIRPGAARPGAAFADLNEYQRSFFMYWRGECRRGVPPVLGSIHAESYIRLYGGELVLHMGREGPLEHFLALRDLRRAYRDTFPETGALLCRWLLDFAAIHGVAGEALPLLLEELAEEEKPFAILRENGQEETAAILLDLAIRRFCTDRPLDTKEENNGGRRLWSLAEALIPEKILRRKGEGLAAGTFQAEYCRDLRGLDARLRRDWGRGFFGLFYPPRTAKTELTAFRGLDLGESAYILYRPPFSSHEPLIEALSVLALGGNPLPGVEGRRRPLSLEGELVESLRRESDAVRKLLASDPPQEGAGPCKTGGDGAKPIRPGEWPLRVLSGGSSAVPASSAPPFTAPDTAALKKFIASLTEKERRALSIIGGGGTPEGKAVSDSVIDAVNEAFNGYFGDLLIETGPNGPSISAEYAAILGEWE